MKIGKNNEIISATIEELKKQWEKGEWNSVYTFEEYLKIQIEQNGVDVKDAK